MATKLKTQSSGPERTLKNPEKIRIALVTARWHEEITNHLTQGAFEKLLGFGILPDNIIKVEVPGAFELPQASKMVLANKNVQAIICLGCVIKGETHHDEFINHAVATGLTNLSMASGKPIIFGVLTTLTYDQAFDRSKGKLGNKGEECAVAAIQMILVHQDLSSQESTIGFK